MGVNIPFYESADTVIYATAGYNGSNDDVAGTEKFSSGIDLAGQNSATLDIKHDSNGTTDDLVANIYRSLDGSFSGAETAVMSITVPSDGSEDIYSLSIGRFNGYGPGYYRLGLVRSGSTDTFDVEVRLRYGN